MPNACNLHKPPITSHSHTLTHHTSLNCMLVDVEFQYPLSSTIHDIIKDDTCDNAGNDPTTLQFGEIKVRTCT